MLKILCFKSGNNLYGIETKYVKEINRNPEITVIPLAPPTVAGMINLRGQIVSLLDFEMLFGCPTTHLKRHSIVLKKEPGETDMMALLVEQAADVIDVDEAVCEPPTPALVNVYGSTIKFIAKLKHELLIIIDKENLL
ncbi:chemotaxis protein CheW [Acetobacterium woodii]|uniref:Chemotaxis protein CheW2 n=1 Tax=Acetobacterium woodii (strain ATCC 29683 / DSM 1030 / JCM 2381 / KCTC 1655 / WB1) TaxID=931626 RepID=H6LJ81_ACEWD|nr:chemotaxis protein CheW [Acetobacterium woodii]AFA48644.1 chemotaxis protein CheW2 [Acetobacterium woodii DSM 1030]